MSAPAIELRPGAQTRDGITRSGFFADIAGDGAPKSLIFRLTAESAREQGAAYAEAYWEIRGGAWRAVRYLADGARVATDAP